MALAPALTYEQADAVMRLGPLQDPHPLVTLEPWMDRARCADADPSMWFPDKGEPIDNAVRVCRTCPVRADCLALALREDHEDGVFGGLSRSQRRRVTLLDDACDVGGVRRTNGSGPSGPCRGVRPSAAV